MSRRILVIAVLAAAVLACAAGPALAYGPYLSYPVDGGARLVQGASQAVYMWSEPAGATSSLKASRVERGAGGATGPYSVVADIPALSGWFASGDGLSANLLWKSGGTVYVTRYDLSTGAGAYVPAPVCTDAQAAALRGVPGTTVVPAGIAADGQGGAYIWCTVSPAPTSGGYTLLNHVSATGALATSTPAMKVVERTVVALDSDDAGHAFVLLTGGSDVTVDRLGPTLASDWNGARDPYLIHPAPSPAQTALDLVASDGALVSWREGAKIKVARFEGDGDRLWINPPSVSVTGAVKLAADGSGGAYVAGVANGGLFVRHVLSSGQEAPWGGSSLPGLGLTQPRVDAVTTNSAGDLFVAYSSVVSVGKPGIALLTYTGGWTDVGPAGAGPVWYSGAVPDGSGGAYVMGGGGGAVLWRIADAGAQVTLRPRAEVVEHGQKVVVAGYATTAGGVPMAGATVLIRKVTAAGMVTVGSATATAGGYFTSTMKPTANGTYVATAGGTESAKAVIKVATRVRLDALSHLRPQGTRLIEILTGAVSPRHAGQRVVIQKAVGSRWRTVASGRVDSRSRFRVVWALPYKTATYKLRAAVPAHADHAEGASQTATLRVVIKKG
jgi:hypothetical protein